MTSGRPFKLASAKIGLIDHLREIESINVKIDLNKNTHKSTKDLQYEKESHIKSVKKITSFLNSIGKMSDSEAIKLMKLDFNSKDFNLKFKIGR